MIRSTKLVTSLPGVAGFQIHYLCGVIFNLKILILQNQILHYRIPLYNRLHEEFGLTVLHCGESVEGNFSQVILEKCSYGPVTFVKKLYSALSAVRYDVVIAMGDFRWPQFFFIKFFMPKKSRCILWGVDTGSSKAIDSLKAFFLNVMGVPIIFYSQLVAAKWKHRLRNKMYVAQNSIYVLPPIFDNHRTNIVNVGSLASRKRNDLLIAAFSALPTDILSVAKLVFVGGGEEENQLRRLARERMVEDKVIFMGHISDPHRLREIYSEAFVSVSVGQAGLAVSQSIGNGVPFISHKNAITGGEIFGIKEGVTGSLLELPMASREMESELCDLVVKYWSARGNQVVYISARQFYERSLSFEAQVSAFILAISGNQDNGGILV